MTHDLSACSMLSAHSSLRTESVNLILYEKLHSLHRLQSLPTPRDVTVTHDDGLTCVDLPVAGLQRVGAVGEQIGLVQRAADLRHGHGHRQRRQSTPRRLRLRLLVLPARALKRGDHGPLLRLRVTRLADVSLQTLHALHQLRLALGFLQPATQTSVRGGIGRQIGKTAKCMDIMFDVLNDHLSVWNVLKMCESIVH